MRQPGVKRARPAASALTTPCHRYAWYLIVAVLSLSGCSSEPEALWFDNQAATRGIDFRHDSGFRGTITFPQHMGGGVALLDADGDGDLDVFLVQSHGDGNALYLNDGKAQFQLTQAGVQHAGYGMGVAAGDYDNDGDVDLYVTNVGSNALFRNDDGAFTEVTTSAAVDDPAWSTGAAFVDFDNDGFLDLFVANYVQWTPGMDDECYNPATDLLDACPPSHYLPTTDSLFHNNGDGTFTNVSGPAGLLGSSGNGLGVVASDFNQDGLVDIFVANDMTANHLWMNYGSSGFEEEAATRGVAVDRHAAIKAGMGVAAVDTDNDRDTDLLVVNMIGQTDSLFRNDGGQFTDITGNTGLDSSNERYTRFGIALADFDNDGWLDLYQANGGIFKIPDTDLASYEEPNLLFRGNAEGRFEPHPNHADVHTSRGLAYGDLDNDGGLDLVIVNRDGPAYVLINQVPERGEWVRFQVLTSDGRHALGATLDGSVGTQAVHREVQAFGSYLATHDPAVQLGLARHKEIIDVVVTWPGGQREHFGRFDAGRTHVLRQGNGSVLPE
jgi:enediyne biosynthesis protein E4